MTGHQKLRLACGGTALFGKFRQQTWVEEILRLFDANEWRWGGIMQQHEIGQHLQCSIGSEPGQNGVTEGRILDLQQQMAIWHHFRNNLFDSRHALPQHGEDLLQPLGMLLR